MGIASSAQWTIGRVVARHTRLLRSRRRAGIALSCAATLAVLMTGQATAGTAPSAASSAADASASAPQLVPQPVSVRTVSNSAFTLGARAKIIVPAGSSKASAVGAYLARVLRPSTGYAVPVTTPPARGQGGDVSLALRPDRTLGTEGYRLDVTRGGVRLAAPTAAGLFHGVQTLRQLLPAQIESPTVVNRTWTVPGVHIVDYPRFAWRGAMLDVSRHFFPVSTVESYIDLLSQYKINVLHLHLSDDQGWRIAIKGWPRLTSYGGSTEVGGGPGGYYTQQDYRNIVRYAAQHYITIVPEIDGPGHVNAALASYAKLNCDNTAPPLYTGTNVGFSSFCVHKPITYRFLNDVIGQLAALTPGRYIHIGGDEAHSTKPADYVYYVEHVEKIVQAHGKKMIGWHQIGSADITPGSLAQYWGLAGSQPDITLAHQAVQQGAKLVMSPADRIYLDMKYNPQTPLGLNWAGYNSVEDAYSWDPATFVPGIGESDIRGVEAPLWSETLQTLSDIEFMAFPRLPGVAEIGWSPQGARSWDTYRTRLAAQGPRWDLMGVNYYRSPQVPWPS